MDDARGPRVAAALEIKKAFRHGSPNAKIVGDLHGFI